MARVRQKGTLAELKTAAILKSLGRHYRKNVRTLPGSPDFANKRRRWAVFVQGCFWHHHKNCCRATIPKTNSSFWTQKFAANRKRDAKALKALRKQGFAVVMIWECELGNQKKAKERLSKVFEARRIDVR